MPDAPLHILYFAWLRDRAGRAEEHLILPKGIATAGDLLAHLRARDPQGAATFAQPADTRGRDPMAGDAIARSGAADADELTDGEVRKVDRDAGRLTLRHGPLRNLDMPGMTMVFDVADAAVLERLRPGEKVRFQAGKVDGRFVVVRIEPSTSPTP